MVQMRQVVANLRLSLADIEARESNLNDLVKQFQTQLNRLPRQAIYGRVSLDMSLSAMAEIEERLESAKTSRRHLLSIKARAQQELEALEVVQRVEEAKGRLSQLKSQEIQNGNSDDGTTSEIRQLEDYITQYSKQAERSIITMSRVREER